MLLTLMGAGAISGHQKEASANQQDTFNSTASSSYSKLQSESCRGSAGPRSGESQSTLKASVTVTGSWPSRNQGPTMKMSCEMCSTNFTLFKRKKFCQECHRYFCSTCLPKPPSSQIQVGRQCSKCKLLMSGQFSRGDLQDWKVKDIRCFLNVRKIPMIGCKEKHDLDELVLAHFCTKRRNSLQDQAEHDILVQHMAARMQNDDDTDDQAATLAGMAESGPQPHSGTQSNPSESNQDASQEDARDDGPSFDSGQWRELFDSMERIQEMFSRHTSHQEDRQPSSASDSHKSNSPQKQRCHIESIHVEYAIENLTVKQLKELLVNNFVDYKGCCEKPELVDRVKRLWRDHQINKAKAEKIHLADEAEAVGKPVPSPSRKFTMTSSAKPDEPLDGDGNVLSSTSDIPSASGHASDAIDAALQSDDSLCRVCMDALCDCILLECGHMVTCTACGKQLAECPICRQYIVRVVRVFKS